jgi:hypothetical protein
MFDWIVVRTNEFLGADEAGHSFIGAFGHVMCEKVLVLVVGGCDCGCRCCCCCGGGGGGWAVVVVVVVVVVAVVVVVVVVVV